MIIKESVLRKAILEALSNVDASEFENEDVLNKVEAHEPHDAILAQNPIDPNSVLDRTIIDIDREHDGSVLPKDIPEFLIMIRPVIEELPTETVPELFQKFLSLKNRLMNGDPSNIPNMGEKVPERTEKELFKPEEKTGDTMQLNKNEVFMVPKQNFGEAVEYYLKKVRPIIGEEKYLEFSKNPKLLENNLFVKKYMESKK